MRLPLVSPLDSRDGQSNADSRLTNVLVENAPSGAMVSVRPSLSRVSGGFGPGDGKGIVAFGDDLLSVYGSTLAVADPYVQTDLDDGVQTQHYANGVSENGSLVVGYNGASTTNGLVWLSDATVSREITGPGDVIFNAVTGESITSAVVVGYADSVTFRPTPCKWTDAGGLTYLSMLGGDTGAANDCCPNAIVGYAAIDGGVLGWNPEQACKWTISGSITALTAGYSSEFESYAESVSVDGSVIVGRMVDYTQSTPNEYLGFVWRSGVVEYVRYPNARRTELLAVSPDGSVIGGRYQDNDLNWHGFLWSDSLGYFTLPSSVVTVNAIANFGLVVVGGSYVWTQSDGAVRIKNNYDPPTANDITSSGELIVGVAQITYNGPNRAAFWTPTPSIISSALSGDFFDFAQSTL